MSVESGVRVSRADLQATNFFLDLPDEMLQTILRYMTPQEGLLLMVTQKALHGRLIEILLANQSSYLNSLCTRILSYFLFAPDEYRQRVAAVGEKALCADDKQLTLKDLEDESQSFGAMISPHHQIGHGRYPSLFFKRNCQGSSFFYPSEERIGEALVEVGLQVVDKYGLQNRALESAEKEEGDKKQRETCIELAISLRGVKGEKAFRLINAITDEREREKAMHIWIRRVDKNDPFLATEEFFASITPLALIKHLIKTGEGGDQVLPLLDKTIRHPNKGMRKEVLFLFFEYWCEHGCTFEEHLRAPLYSKVIALIKTLPEAERNVGVFGVLQGMISRQLFFEVEELFFSYPLRSLPYLQYQVDREGASPLHIMETLPQIMKQISEHKRFNERLGIATSYYCDLHRYPVIKFFAAAIGRVRKQEEASLILDRALEQIAPYGMNEIPEFFGDILSEELNYAPSIRKIIEEKRRELIREVVVS